jgi:hypothetical protein
VLGTWCLVLGALCLVLGALSWCLVLCQGVSGARISNLSSWEGWQAVGGVVRLGREAQLERVQGKKSSGNGSKLQRQNREDKQHDTSAHTQLQNGSASDRFDVS